MPEYHESEFSVDVKATILVRVTGTAGDVAIEGHDDNRVQIESDHSIEHYFRQEDDVVTVTGFPGDLQLRVPHGASVELNGVGGDIEVRDVANLGASDSAKLVANGIGGDADIENVGRIELGSIGGDTEVQGDCFSFVAANIGGDLHIERAEQLTFRAVGGDAQLDRITRLNGLGHIGGDLELNWEGEAEGDLRAIVGGDAEIKLHGAPNLKLTAMVGGDFSGRGAEWRATSSSGPKTIVFGEGATQFSLTVGGDLSLRSDSAPSDQSGWSGDWARNPNMDAFGEEMRNLGRDLEEMGRTLARDLSSLGRDIAREVRVAGRETMRGMKDDIGPRGRGRGRININGREINFDTEQVERIKREARAAAASGIAQAQEAVERALGQWTRPGVPPVPPSPRRPQAPRPPQAPGEPPVGNVYTGQTIRMDVPTPPEAPEAPEAPQPVNLDSQRLAILKMVHEGRLSPDEAEMLLRGLEQRR